MKPWDTSKHTVAIQREAQIFDIFIFAKILYYDAVIYHETGVKATVDFADPTNIMLGTDHPFFPLLENQNGGPERWMSVDSNLAAITDSGLDKKVVEGILGSNALRLLNLTLPASYTKKPLV
ncbi:hypothetical protein CLU79DRAFT_840171 [Phycomyces nitens]|nr:hypothetical protein CLU79DRAFT_840171 [Phycomyces nitens]